MSVNIQYFFMGVKNYFYANQFLTKLKLGFDEIRKLITGGI